MQAEYSEYHMAGEFIPRFFRTVFKKMPVLPQWNKGFPRFRMEI